MGEVNRCMSLGTTPCHGSLLCFFCLLPGCCAVNCFAHPARYDGLQLWRDTDISSLKNKQKSQSWGQVLTLKTMVSSPACLENKFSKSLVGEVKNKFRGSICKDEAGKSKRSSGHRCLQPTARNVAWATLSRSLREGASSGYSNSGDTWARSNRFGAIIAKSEIKLCYTWGPKRAALQGLQLSRVRRERMGISWIVRHCHLGMVIPVYREGMMLDSGTLAARELLTGTSKRRKHPRMSKREALQAKQDDGIFA